MKTAIDKNESEVQKMKREALEWIDRHGKTAPPFLTIAVNTFPEPQPEVCSTEKSFHTERVIPTKDSLLNMLDKCGLHFNTSDLTFLTELIYKWFESRLSAISAPVTDIKPSDSDIEKYFPVKDQNNLMRRNNGLRQEGAKAMRDGLIGHSGSEADNQPEGSSPEHQPVKEVTEEKECYCSLCERHYKNYKRFRIHMIKCHYPIL